MRIAIRAIPLAVALVLAACQADAPEPVLDTASPATADTALQPARSTDTATVPVPQPADAAAAPGFVDRTWVVQASSAVAEGTTYRFNGDGRLEITGPDGGAPTVGAWRVLDESRIEMTEEGIAYTVDILEQDDARLRLRSHNPGEPVKITLVPAAAPAQ